MKCSKCGYLGFEQVERCRNCGYEFSLAKRVPLPELPIRTDSGQLGPLEDLSLVDPATSAQPHRPLKRVNPDLDRVFGSIQDFTPAALPLFPTLADDDQPLITKPSAPRSPLSV